MEPKANYAVVGIFITLFALVGLGIAAWLLGMNTGKQYDEYIVITTSSVGGLRKDSDVRYKGVRVGKVLDVKIDPKNPEYIKIYIAVEKDLPIKTDTKAKITSNGLTGIAYVNLIGGSKNAPLLKSVSNEEYPVIKAVPTTLEKLSVLAGKLMKNLTELLSKLNGLINENTSKYINGTLKHIYATSKHIDEVSKSLKATQRKLNKLLNDTDTFVVSLNKNSKSIDGLIKDAKLLVREATALTKDTDNVVRNTGANLNKSSKDVAAFASTGLKNINGLIIQLNQTTEKLGALIDEIQSSPSVLLRGRSASPGPGEH